MFGLGKVFGSSGNAAQAPAQSEASPSQADPAAAAIQNMPGARTATMFDPVSQDTNGGQQSTAQPVGVGGINWEQYGAGLAGGRGVSMNAFIPPEVAANMSPDMRAILPFFDKALQAVQLGAVMDSSTLADTLMGKRFESERDSFNKTMDERLNSDKFNQGIQNTPLADPRMKPLADIARANVQARSPQLLNNPQQMQQEVIKEFNAMMQAFQQMGEPQEAPRPLSALEIVENMVKQQNNPVAAAPKMVQ